MLARAKEGACLAALVKLAIPLCQEAERQCPRTGPGRPPDFPDWQMATLIMIAVLAQKKSKSAQYRYLFQHRHELHLGLGGNHFPARSTYFDRYRRAHRMFAVAIRRQGRQALAEGWVDGATLAVDKSLLTAKGPPWPPKARRAGRVVRGSDREAAWGYSEHHGWVYGYSYEVVVTATAGSIVFPVLASADTASRSEAVSLGEKIDHLPSQSRHLLADRAYDKNEYGHRIEYDAHGRRSGRHFICPPIQRHRPPRRRAQLSRQSRQRRIARQRRERRIAFYRSRNGRRLHARRVRTVEPFNEWFKNLFDLHAHVWHRGLDNNRTQLLAAICGYQLLVRMNCGLQRFNGQVKWLLDGL